MFLTRGAMSDKISVTDCLLLTSTAQWSGRGGALFREPGVFFGHPSKTKSTTATISPILFPHPFPPLISKTWLAEQPKRTIDFSQILQDDQAILSKQSPAQPLMLERQTAGSHGHRHPAKKSWTPATRPLALSNTETGTVA